MCCCPWTVGIGASYPRLVEGRFGCPPVVHRTSARTINSALPRALAEGDPGSSTGLRPSAAKDVGSRVKIWHLNYRQILQFNGPLGPPSEDCVVGVFGLAMSWLLSHGWLSAVVPHCVGWPAQFSLCPRLRCYVLLWRWWPAKHPPAAQHAGFCRLHNPPAHG